MNQPVTNSALMGIISHMRDHLVPIVACITLTVVCFSLFYIEETGIPVKQYLQLSSENIWGVITLMFVHNDWGHLTRNITMLWFLLMLALLPDSVHSMDYKRGRALFLIIAIFPAAIAAHSIWYIIAYIMTAENSVASAGLSGLTYAFMGSIIARLSINAFDSFSKWRIAVARKDRKTAEIFVLMNGAIAGMLIVFSVFIPEFIGGAHHFFGFAFGLTSILFIESFLRRRNDIVVNPESK
jgi:membrane associated rhomboid family serine protease